MVNKKDEGILLLFSFLILIGLLGNVIAIEYNYSQFEFEDLLGKELYSDVFGFNTEKSFGGYLAMGLLAGFWIWVIYAFVRFTRWGYDFKRKRDFIKTAESDKDLLRRGPHAYLNFVAGRIWKVPLIGIGFAVLMQIPILNRILQALTLEFWLSGEFLWYGFWRSVWIAFLIGFLPFLIEKYLVHKMAIGYEKGIYDVKKMREAVKEKNK